MIKRRRLLLWAYLSNLFFDVCIVIINKIFFLKDQESYSDMRRKSKGMQKLLKIILK